VRPTRPRARKSPALPKHLREYLTTLVNPYDMSADIGVPDKLNRKTAKRTYFIRGTMKSGTNGFGYVALDPKAFLSNDRVAMVHSNGAFTGNSISLNSAATGVIADYSNSEFSAASVAANGIAARVISAGIRVVNRTPALTKGGVAIGLMEPDQNSLSGETFASLGSYPSGRALSGDTSKWLHAEWSPTTPADFDFEDVVNSSTTELDTAPLAIAIETETTDPQLYYYEAVVHIELIGKLSGMSRNVVDPAGQGVALQIMSELGNGLSDKWITKVEGILNVAAGMLDATRKGVEFAGSIAALF